MLTPLRTLPARAWRRFARWRVMRQLAGPRVLRALARERPEAFFVEIGANDGTMMDPLHATILASRWRGILVEPVPDLFARLSKTYGALAERLRPANVAIGGRDGPMPFYRLRDVPGQAPLKPWASGLGSFRKDVILKHRDRIPALEAHLEQIDVPCLTWDSFCRRFDVERLDVLLIDTEGSEAEILAQLDWQRWRPALLIYEHHHMDRAALAALDARLAAAGYVMFREGLDTWCLDTAGAARTSDALRRRCERWVRRGRFAVPVTP